MSYKEQTKSPNLEHKEFSKKIADYILLDQIGQGTFSKGISYHIRANCCRENIRQKKN